MEKSVNCHRHSLHDDSPPHHPSGDSDSSLFVSQTSLQNFRLFQLDDFFALNKRQFLADLWDRYVRRRRFVRVGSRKLYVQRTLYDGRFARIDLVSESAKRKAKAEWVLKRMPLELESDLQEAAHEFNTLSEQSHPLCIYAVDGYVEVAATLSLIHI